MTARLITILLLLSVPLFSQTPKASGPELKWAFFHPFAALQVKKISKHCNSISNQSTIKIQLDSFSNGGKLDAYRHAFFMAAYSQKIKIRKLRKLGIAHEKNNYRQFLKSKTENGEVADSVSSIMDLQNNELGFKTGSQNKKTALEELNKLVITEIKNGKALIMKRDKTGDYLDCEGKKIDLSLYFKKWLIPKCLVASSIH